MKEYRNPADVHAPLAEYTHQIEVRDPQRWLVLSGQVGRLPDGAVPEDAVAQLEIALENLARNLHAAGMDPTDLVKLTFYIAGEMDAARRRDVLAGWLKDVRPCMTLLYVTALASPIYKVEVDAWACRDE
jgi:enamine deaminase RidA (YjgF/YER057c/UK114 family)